MLKEDILKSKTAPNVSSTQLQPASDLTKVMAVFSTQYLGHFRSQVMPLAEKISVDSRFAHKLLTALLTNFPDCPAWQVQESSTADWVFMVRPVLHLALKSAEDRQSFWHRLLVSPQNFRQVLLPFMPGDEAAAVLAVLGTAQGQRAGVYQCRCGYTYTIGNCTQPWVRAQCPECHGQIGGENHQLQRGNRRLEDTGHDAWRRRTGRPGYSNVRGEAARQTWRDLTVTELRSGRFFLHGLLSLGTALQRAARSDLAELSAADLMRNMASDWQVLKELCNCSSEEMSECLHAIAKQSWYLPAPAGQQEADRTHLERLWSQHLRRAPSGRT